MTSFCGQEVKSTWVTRRVPTNLDVAWERPAAPEVGDLLLCEVVRTSLHGRVETTLGSRAKLYAGDRIVCAVANRYATSLLEAVAHVGEDQVDMIAASGLCGQVVFRNHNTNKPTSLRPLAQAFVDGRPLNLRSYALGPPPPPRGEPQWVIVVGSAMDSGKTTACASLIRGLVSLGRRVGASKLTGTASGRDFGAYRDAGAEPVLDFLDTGWPSTVGCTTRQLVDTVDVIAGHLRGAGVEWAVLEIADGLLQTETMRLLESLRHRLKTVHVVLTAQESLAAVAGVERLTLQGHRIVAVSGLITNSPLACREVELTCTAPCVPTNELGRRLAQGSLSDALAFPDVDDEDLELPATTTA